VRRAAAAMRQRLARRAALLVKRGGPRQGEEGDTRTASVTSYPSNPTSTVQDRGQPRPARIPRFREEEERGPGDSSSAASTTPGAGDNLVTGIPSAAQEDRGKTLHAAKATERGEDAEEKKDVTATATPGAVPWRTVGAPVARTIRPAAAASRPSPRRRTRKRSLKPPAQPSTPPSRAASRCWGRTEEVHQPCRASRRRRPPRHRSTRVSASLPGGSLSFSFVSLSLKKPAAGGDRMKNKSPRWPKSVDLMTERLPGAALPYYRTESEFVRKYENERVKWRNRCGTERDLSRPFSTLPATGLL